MTVNEAIKGQYLASVGGDTMRKRLSILFPDDPEVERNLQTATPHELFDMWLDYEGVLGYTDQIIKALRESGYVVEPVEVSEEDA